MTSTNRKPRAPRGPRDPATRRTRLAPGEIWTVPADGRVKRADYRLYMRSPEWLARRWDWWRDAGKPRTCAACSGPWTVTQGHLHHRSYANLGHELHADLVNLCTHCHGVVHSRVNRWRDLERITDLVVAEIRAAHRLT